MGHAFFADNACNNPLRQSSDAADTRPIAILYRVVVLHRLRLARYARRFRLSCCSNTLLVVLLQGSDKAGAEIRVQDETRNAAYLSQRSI